MISQKTLDSEETPPLLIAELDNLRGGVVKIIFNNTRNHFKYDVIDIQIGGTTATVVRDDLVAAIVNGARRSGQPDEDEGG